jgi:Fe2+ transport system protein B
MADTAGTLCKAANVIMERGANSVRAIVTHGVMSGNAIENVNSSALTEIAFTDSIPFDCGKCSKVKILTIADMFADTIHRVQEQQENSYIGRIGKAMEPVIEPLGFDWKLGIGILSGVGAKELVVSTLGVLYADDAEADAVSLGERIPITPLVAFGYMVFVLIYFPCIATLAAIKGESGSWKWAVFAGLYTTALAWLMSFAIYQIGGLFL